ncbi:MAG: hypothetical protein CEN90_95 [Parcubacteria group bacterium Licking1014_17]|nr:MAG: hypothetical protein CEN90_95 [Parcubacteria group bacterium Licking1014_17]
MPGYVHSASLMIATYSTAAATNGFASLSYSLKVTGIKSELAGTLAVDGSVASASVDNGTEATYSANVAYIPVKVSSGSFTLRGEADGYVNKTLTTITVASGSQQTAHFDNGTDLGATDWVGDKLPFAVKVHVAASTNSGNIPDVSGATVKAGDAYGVSCTDNSDGYYYCAVTEVETGVTAEAYNIGYGFGSTISTCAYDDRTNGRSGQSTCSIAFTEAHSSGSSSYVYPTPTPTPEESVTPTPAVSPSTSVTPTPVRTPEPETQTLATVNLYRRIGDTKVYVDTGGSVLSWVKTAEQFIAAGYKWEDVKNVPAATLAPMVFAGQVKVNSGITLRIRSLPSLSGAILGRTYGGAMHTFTGFSSGWYKIDKGWISGAYVKEI